MTCCSIKDFANSFESIRLFVRMVDSRNYEKHHTCPRLFLRQSRVHACSYEFPSNPDVVASPNALVTAVLVALSVCNSPKACSRPEAEIQPLPILALQKLSISVPALAQARHLNGPVVSRRLLVRFRAPLCRSTASGLLFETIVVERQVTWHAGRENSNAKFDGRNDGRVYVVPWFQYTSEADRRRQCRGYK